MSTDLVANHEHRISRLEQLVDQMRGLDQLTIDRCMATAHNAIDEIVNALEATASLVPTDQARNQANAARMMNCKLREFEALLGPAAIPPAPVDPLFVGRRVFHNNSGRYGTVDAVPDPGMGSSWLRVKFDNSYGGELIARCHLKPVGPGAKNA